MILQCSILWSAQGSTYIPSSAACSLALVNTSNATEILQDEVANYNKHVR